MDTRSIALGALSQVHADQRIDDPPWLMTELAALLTERGRQNAPEDLPAVLAALREQLCLRDGIQALHHLERRGAPRLRKAVQAVSMAVRSQMEDALVEASLRHLLMESSTREERALLREQQGLFRVIARLIARTLLERRSGSTVPAPRPGHVLQAVAAQAEAARTLGAGWFAERWPLLLVCVQTLTVQQATMLAQDPRSLLALHLQAEEDAGAAGAWSPIGSLQEAQHAVMKAVRAWRSRTSAPFLGGSVRHNGARWARVLPSGRIVTEGERLGARELDPASLPARPLFVLEPEQLLRGVAPSWLALSEARARQLVRAATEAGPETLRRLRAELRGHRPDLAGETQGQADASAAPT